MEVVGLMVLFISYVLLKLLLDNPLQYAHLILSWVHCAWSVVLVFLFLCMFFWEPLFCTQACISAYLLVIVLVSFKLEFGWDELYYLQSHVDTWNGYLQSTKGRRPRAEDIDAPSRLPLLNKPYYRDILGEYGAFFAIANSIDRVHKNAWIGFQSWRATASKVCGCSLYCFFQGLCFLNLLWPSSRLKPK